MPRGTNVLVLEDEPELLGTLTTYLEECGYVVHAAADALAASAHLVSRPIDIAVIDVGAHGLRVAREATTRNIPSIQMSGKRVIFEIGGIGEVLHKPFALRDLQEAIEAALARYENIGRPQPRTTDDIVAGLP
jgi:DNA-binding response OmpR family regulator